METECLEIAFTKLLLFPHSLLQLCRQETFATKTLFFLLCIHLELASQYFHLAQSLPVLPSLDTANIGSVAYFCRWTHLLLLLFCRYRAAKWQASHRATFVAKFQHCKVSHFVTLQNGKFHTLLLCKVASLTHSYIAQRAVEFDCGNDHAL